jgi:hypothetical protein
MRSNNFNPLKPEEREREEKVGGVAVDTTFNGGTQIKFKATKVPRQCSLVLLVMVNLVKVRRLEVEKVKR